MSAEIINVLNYICDKIGIAVDWTAENVWPQVMDILGRYRILQLIANSIWFIASICVFIVFAILWINVFKSRNFALKEHTSTFWWEYYSHHNNIDANLGVIILTLFTIIIGTIMIFVLIDSVRNLLTWLLVPEIKYLDMLKTYIQ